MTDKVFYKYYIVIDHQSRIIDGWSDGVYPDRDTTGAVLLTDHGGYQFRLHTGGEENPALYTQDGIPLYRWDGEQVVRRSEAEIASDRAALPAPAPSEQERLRADVDFLAAMQGVTL